MENAVKLGEVSENVMQIVRRAFKIDCEKQEQARCKRHGIFTRHVTVFQDGKRLEGECPNCVRERDDKILSERKRLALESKMKTLNIEPKYYLATLESYLPENKSESLAVSKCRELITGKIKKLVLLGGNGVGKTHLASAVVKEKQGLLLSMIEIAMAIKRSFKRTDTGDMWEGMDEWAILERLSTVPLLAIDELGRSYSSDAEANWLSYIIDKRETRGLPTVICSNLHLSRDCKSGGGCPQCFENKLSSDVLSRLSGRDTSIVFIEGRDYRQGAML